jgi:hypothetical protein
MWYTMMKPVTASIDVTQSRESVFAFLDVMANHEPFTNHMLVDWRYSGPPSGVGSKAHVKTKLGGLTDEAEIEVIEVEPGRMIRERNVGAKGKRVAHGTYELSDLPGGGTHIRFTWALEKAPLADRALGPVLHGLLTRGNAKAMQRLAEQLEPHAV